MPILPNRFQINDKMPTLGQLVREAIQPEPCKIERFNKGNHGIIPAPNASPTAGYVVTEADCRQIKGAAKLGEWRDCSEDMSDLPAGKYEWAYKMIQVLF